jgi:integrase
LKLATSKLAINDRVISLPARLGRSKNKERFLIPLSKPALDILSKRTARKKSEYVFGEGEGGFSGWSKCKERLNELIGDAIIEPWTLHDFRRTFDTLGQEHVQDFTPHHRCLPQPQGRAEEGRAEALQLRHVSR